MIATFGHSTLDKDAAIRALDAGGVDVLIDVRSHPTSRFTQWRRDALARWMADLTQGSIVYQWWPELGGWDVRHYGDAGLRDFMLDQGVDLAAYSGGAFPKQRIAAGRYTTTHGSGPEWTNQGLYDYAWFTSTGEFNKGLDRLVEMFGDRHQPTAAIMCAEAVPWRCHRSMIADILAARGVEVRHLPRWQDHLDWDIRNRVSRYPEAVRACWAGVSPEAALLAGDS